MEIIIDLQGGKMKLIKTRDLFVIDAHVSFNIEDDIVCAENFEFEEDNLLVKSHPRHFNVLKDIFKIKCKSEILEMTFLDSELLIKGDINKLKDYTLRPQRFLNYGNHMCNGELYRGQFKIDFPMKHILGVNKICELVNGEFNMALDVGGNN
jgi:hypothetical protein